MKSENLAWLIRRHGIEMTHLSGGSHIGAILSVADTIAVLYSDILRYKAEDPDWDGRDRLVMSKGHAGAALYAALAENGFILVEELKTHYQNGSRLSGHVSHHIPGVDFSTGSLGHGLSVAVGMAYAAKKDHKDIRVYAVLGDGECDEGSVWEAALIANHFRLNNLTVVVDHNKMQSMDYCEKTIELNSLAEKWKAFGWHTVEINGNSHVELKTAFGANNTNKPMVIVAHTTKGCGVPFMENDILWHYRFPHAGWEYDQAVHLLHKTKPADVIDPYTPDGIFCPTPIPEGADIYKDHTTSATWHPTWMEE